MKRYMYMEPLGENGEDEPVIRTEQEIIEEYWDYWSKKMEAKYGPNHKSITKENCIQDWCSTHWAWEYNNDLAF